MLTTLLSENAAFANGEHKHFDDVPLERSRLATEGQTPVAAIIACADSRVSPEIIFRANIGQLFVIRAAGNTTWGDEVLGSLEYAVDHLNVSLVLVLGHTKCGAVGAACAGGDPLPGALGKHILSISKGIEGYGGLTNDVDAAVERNVKCSIGFLRKDPCGSITTAEKKRGLVVRGAVYDIGTGIVDVLGYDEGDC